jgi:hypothetical protein
VQKLIAVLTLFFVCACSKQQAADITSHDAASAPESSAVARVSASSDRAAAKTLQVASTEAATLAPSRMIVRSAEMRVIVNDTSKAVADATRAAEAAGGYVTGSQVWREGELLRARLTMRVPAEKLTPTLDQLRGIAQRVENETVSSEDVSEEFVDLGARLRNLEATEEELRQLLVVARQNSRKASEVLDVHRHLTQIRGEIEQIKGRMRYLTQVAAMSSIALDMTPDALAKPVVKPGWQPLAVAREAVRSLIAVAQSGVNATIWLLIYVLPIAAILALFAAVITKVLRRIRAAGAEANS